MCDTYGRNTGGDATDSESHQAYHLQKDLRKRRSVLFLASLVLALSLSACPQVHPAQLKGVEFPDSIRISGTTLVLNGLGLRQATALKVNVYVAGLYVAQKSGEAQVILDAATPKSLVLHFLRNVGGSDLTQAWDEGFEKNVPDQVAALKPRIELIKSFTKDMKTGQRLTFTHIPGAGITVDIDGAVMGTVEGDDFARAFLSIWFGPNPPNKGLKDGLLGAQK